MSGLQVRMLSDTTMARWDDFVQASSTATFFHRAAWKTIVERSFGHRTYFSYVEENGKVRGVLPLVHVRSRLFGNSLVSTAFGVYGGPAAETAAAADLLDRHALALAEELDVDHVEYRSQSRTRVDWACKDSVYATFRRPISGDPDENLRAVPRKQRAVIRKSLAAGLTSSIDADMRDFYRVYAESVRNLGTPVFAYRYLRQIKEAFGDACEILTVRADGRVVSGVVTFRFRDTVLPFYAGGTPDARRLGAFDFMYWDVMRRAGLAGYRSFDFGRSKRGTGAFAFKTNWGFEPDALCYEYYLRRGTVVPDLSPLNPKYKIFINLWRRLPLSVANRVGPALARSLG
jgi:FemAB-related protein (PEP-CTERM system-associated)